MSMAWRLAIDRQSARMTVARFANALSARENNSATAAAPGLVADDDIAARIEDPA